MFYVSSSHRLVTTSWIFFQVCLDKLYMSAANHVFEKKMKPLILEQRKKGQSHSYNNETLKVAKTMMKYIHCIQNSEWAAATAHKITQELPPGQELNVKFITPWKRNSLSTCIKTEWFRTWTCLLNLAISDWSTEVKSQSTLTSLIIL